jgi:hypothetical protein
MDFQTIDHHTPGCIQASLYITQANIRATPPATRCEPSLCDRSGTAHTKRKWHHQITTEHISDPTPYTLAHTQTECSRKSERHNVNRLPGTSVTQESNILTPHAP